MNNIQEMTTVTDLIYLLEGYDTETVNEMLNEVLVYYEIDKNDNKTRN